MKLIERNCDWMYSVYEADTGALYLEVMAGTHGLHPVRARLDEREMELYREGSKESEAIHHRLAHSGTSRTRAARASVRFLRCEHSAEAIALRILKWPERFAGRLLSHEEWMALTGGQELP